MDRENWMGNLPEVLHDFPLTWLAIPGSHDSFSYTIQPDSDIGPDERRLQCFDNCMCFSKDIKRVVFRWSVTQNITCSDQLVDGIRYFDFRLAAKLGTLTPFIVHGMYGTNALDILEEIYKFLSGHQREFVLLDFQHFYNFTDDMHKLTMSTVKRIFGDMLFPYQSSPDLRLKSIWSKKYQVIIFYRNNYARTSNYVWPGDWVPNPWPNTGKHSEMIRILEDEYKKGREANIFFVTQGILTPDFTYIFFHLFTDLRHSLAPKANNALLNWLKLKHAGRSGINVVIADFVGIPETNFSSSVIKLNFKFAKTLFSKKTTTFRNVQNVTRPTVKRKTERRRPRITQFSRN